MTQIKLNPRCRKTTDKTYRNYGVDLWGSLALGKQDSNLSESIAEKTRNAFNAKLRDLPEDRAKVLRRTVLWGELQKTSNIFLFQLTEVSKTIKPTKQRLQSLCQMLNRKLKMFYFASKIRTETMNKFGNVELQRSSRNSNMFNLTGFLSYTLYICFGYVLEARMDVLFMRCSVFLSSFQTRQALFHRKGFSNIQENLNHPGFLVKLFSAIGPSLVYFYMCQQVSERKEFSFMALEGALNTMNLLFTVAAGVTIVYALSSVILDAFTSKEEQKEFEQEKQEYLSFFGFKIIKKDTPVYLVLSRFLEFFKLCEPDLNKTAYPFDTITDHFTQTVVKGGTVKHYPNEGNDWGILKKNKSFYQNKDPIDDSFFIQLKRCFRFLTYDTETNLYLYSLKKDLFSFREGQWRIGMILFDPQQGSQEERLAHLKMFCSDIKKVMDQMDYERQNRSGPWFKNEEIRDLENKLKGVRAVHNLIDAIVSDDTVTQEERLNTIKEMAVFVDIKPYIEAVCQSKLSDDHRPSEDLLFRDPKAKEYYYQFIHRSNELELVYYEVNLLKEFGKTLRGILLEDTFSADMKVSKIRSAAEETQQNITEYCSKNRLSYINNIDSIHDTEELKLIRKEREDLLLPYNKVKEIIFSTVDSGDDKIAKLSSRPLFMLKDLDLYVMSKPKKPLLTTAQEYLDKDKIVSTWYKMPKFEERKAPWYQMPKFNQVNQRNNNGSVSNSSRSSNTSHGSVSNSSSSSNNSNSFMVSQKKELNNLQQIEYKGFLLIHDFDPLLFWFEQFLSFISSKFNLDVFTNWYSFTYFNLDVFTNWYSFTYFKYIFNEDLLITFFDCYNYPIDSMVLSFISNFVMLLFSNRKPIFHWVKQKIAIYRYNRAVSNRPRR